jgi:long-chain fatty acid transport protein
LSKRLVIPALCSALLCAPTIASAGGLAAARFGGELGNPTTSHPTALYFNPAGLALGTGTRIYAEGVFIYRTASYERPVAAIDNVLEGGEMGSGTPEDAIGANSGEASLANFLVSPFAAVVSDLGIDNLGVGLGVYAPFGGQATWDRNQAWEGDETYPGAVDGVQRWATIDGSIRALYLTLGGAYQLGDQLSIGAGVNVVRQEVATTRARTAVGTDDLIATASGAVVEGRSFIDASGTQLAASAGIMWRPLTKLRLGASYQSRPGFGESTLSGTLESKFGSGPVSTTPVDFVHSLPDVVRIGAAFWPSDTLELRLSGDYTRWSVMEYQCLLDASDPEARCAFNADGTVDTAAGGAGVIVNIPRNWKDTFGVRAGASWWAGPALEVMGGLSYDSNAVPDTTMDASIIDMDKLVGSAGVRWTTGPVDVFAALTHVFYLEREVDPRERDGSGVPITLDQPSRTPDGGGTYGQSITLLNLGVQYSF